MALDLETQYDRIYRYCYYKLRSRSLAEDVTQETFLRCFASDTWRGTGQTLQYLYTTARNLCVDEFRRRPTLPLEEQAVEWEEDTLESIALRAALDALDGESRELVLLRYVSEVPVGVLCRIYGVSRFALYRRLRRALGQLRDALGEEETL